MTQTIYVVVSSNKYGVQAWAFEDADEAEAFREKEIREGTNANDIDYIATELTPKGSPPAQSAEPEHPEVIWRNHYTCYECGYDWEDQWTAQCDDDCPECGARHCEPHTSEKVE